MVRRSLRVRTDFVGALTLAFLTLLCLPTSAEQASTAPTKSTSASDLKSPHRLENEHRVGAYTFDLYALADNDDDMDFTDRVLHVVKDGQVIYRLSLDAHVLVFTGTPIVSGHDTGWLKVNSDAHDLAHPGDSELGIVRGVSLDFDRDGKNEILVFSRSVGMHCCYRMVVLSVGDQFKELGDLDGEDTSFTISDENHDGHPEINVLDWTFAYWNTSFLDSWPAVVTLTYSDGKLTPDAGLMLRPKPGKREFNERLTRLNNSTTKDVYSSSSTSDIVIPSLVWSNMLDLIYTGNGQTAWILLDKWWPKGEEGKSQFHDDFMKQLKTSPYWDGVKKLNKW